MISLPIIFTSYEYQRIIQPKRGRNLGRGKEGDGAFLCYFRKDRLAFEGEGAYAEAVC